MSNYTDDELYQALTDTGRLLRDVVPVEGEEYSLDAILAEFGRGAAEPAPEQAETTPEPDEEETAPAVEDDEVPAEQGEITVEEPVIPVKTDPALMDTLSLQQLLEANMHPGTHRAPQREEKTERPAPEPVEKQAEPVAVPPAEEEAPARPAGKKRPVLQMIFGGLGRKRAPVEEQDDPDDTKEFPVEDPDDTKEIIPKKEKHEIPEEPRQEPPEEIAEEIPEETDEPATGTEEPAREILEEIPEETAEEVRREEPDPEVFPDEPEGMHKVPLEQVMSQTVESVLDEDDAILEKPEPLSRRVREVAAAWRERLAAQLARPAAKEGESPWEDPENASEPEAPEPEPDMELAAKEAKRLCKRLHRHTVLSALPAVLLAALSVADTFGILDGLWGQIPLLRPVILGVLLLATALLALPVWQEMAERLKQGRPGCELAAALTAAVVLADCAYTALRQSGGTIPFAAPAAAMIWLCQLGLLLAAESRWEAFHLADIGGTPPYGVSVTSAGACKQKGTIDGFYHNTNRTDPARKWQRILVPLYLAAATVLAGVVILSRHVAGDPLWVWSALLVATIPLGLPLTGTLPLKYLNHRLVKSGSAVAGYHGAWAVSRSRRMVVTDDDLFPPGTVGLNGLKVYGEEIGKVVSYAASITREAHSQLNPLFEQLLTAEGGFHQEVEDLHYYEEGGVGGTIEGESVTMGSAYFMRKNHVTLPAGLKLKTGVFLAVDGVLIAIFAIKYAPSRNVEWALRALRRNRIEPVLGVRSSNVTPGLLKRKFSLDVKPVYPDVSTRLALSDLSRETAEKSNAIIYREGLMPFAETAVGSRRMIRALRDATVLAWLGGLCGLLLAYYLTGVGAFGLLDPLRMLVFQALWLLPTWLLSGLVKHY